MQFLIALFIGMDMTRREEARIGSQTRALVTMTLNIRNVKVESIGNSTQIDLLRGTNSMKCPRTSTLKKINVNVEILRTPGILVILKKIEATRKTGENTILKNKCTKMDPYLNFSLKNLLHFFIFFRNERERQQRSHSDDKHHAEEKPKRDRDHRDRRDKDTRHSKDEIDTEGWGDHPTDFHTHSYGPPQGFRGGPFSK